MVPPRRHGRIALIPASIVVRDLVSGVIGVPQPRFGPFRAWLVPVWLSLIVVQV